MMQRHYSSRRMSVLFFTLYREFLKADKKNTKSILGYNYFFKMESCFFRFRRPSSNWV